MGGGIQYADGSSGQVSTCTLDGTFGTVAVTINSTLDLTNTRIAKNPINVSVETYSHLSGSGNVLEGGVARTMHFSGNSTASFHGNHILRADGPSVETFAYLTNPVQIDLTGNYWGTASRDSIAAWILDGTDPPTAAQPVNESEVLFEPFEPGPIPVRRQSAGSIKALFLPKN